MTTRALCTALSLLVAAAAPREAAAQGPPARLYVDADAPPGGTGESWASALNDLEQAVVIAEFNPAVAEIWVAEGIYRPVGGRLSSFRIRSGLALHGGFVGVETALEERNPDPAAHPSVLSGDLNGDDGPGFAGNGENAFHVVRADGGVTLDRFTITAGNADGDALHSVGAGLLIRGVNPVVIDCTIRENSAGREAPVSGVPARGMGAGVYCTIDSTPLFTRCAIVGNRTVRGGVHEVNGPERGGDGAGVFVDRSTPVFVECAITGNSAGAGASGPGINMFRDGAAGGSGGGVYIADGNPDFERCTIRGNSAGAGGNGFGGAANGGGGRGGSGGGVYATGGADVELVLCEIGENHGGAGGNAGGGPARIQGADGGDGGGLAVAESSFAELLLCRVVGNEAGAGGAGAGGGFGPGALGGRGGAGGGAYAATGAGLFVPGSLVAANRSGRGGRGGTGEVGGDGGPGGDGAGVSYGADVFQADIRNSTVASNVAGAGGDPGNGGPPGMPMPGAPGPHGQGGGVFISPGTVPVIFNSILYWNQDSGLGTQSAQIHMPGGDSFSVAYCCVQGLDGSLGGPGNIGSDPRFRDPVSFRPGAGSPCIDAGCNNCTDSGATDIDGNPRRLDDPATPDTGFGTPPIVDIGAHEFCPRDCDGDGVCDDGTPDGFAVAFDGVDDYVQAGSDPSLRLTGPLTIEARIYPTGPGSKSGGIIVSKEGEYEIGRFQGGEIAWALANTTPGWVLVNTGVVAPQDQWTHIAFVYTGHAAGLYINGALASSRSASGPIGDAIEGQDDLRVGVRQAFPQYFEGLIDEVRIWNRLRLAPEIQVDDARTLNGPQPGLVAYYRFDEGTGLTAHDRSGDNDGVLVNGAAWASTTSCTPACPADWDQDGAVNSNDYFDYLTDYFAGNGQFNEDGQTNSDDYFAFLGAYFDVCD